MATKLYPPVIEGTIPAFSGTTLVVPFSLNRAVSKSEIAGFVIKIKTVQGSTLLGTIKQTDPDLFDIDSLMEVQFDVESIAFTVGQYYKIQMAFINQSGSTGYYSTVGVVKYTTAPKIEISGLVSGKINNHNYYYTGVYSQKGQDTSEKLYSSRFVLYNADNEIVKDSGEILHNVADDVSAYEAHEEFELSMDLEINTSYYLQFSVTTTNKYTASTKKYRIMQKKSVTPDLKATLSANLCFEDGYIDLYLVGEKDSSGVEQIAIGSFVVCRAASNEDYVWNKVCEFSLQSQTPSRFLWRDYTIEQGVTYQYSVQQYNDYGLFSDRILSTSITADFEDAFLYDGSRQLKIRYNPKISSFKTDILESKTDTIGSKHPFIFRNGSVYYREFPISGLISYQMDDNHLFMSWSDLGIDSSSFNFTSDNLLAERLFKMEVLEWLNNGEEKLFRSPTEGNYIVRLMNNSLSPQDSLGRMLHTFSSTAYEVADFTYENLNSRGFITITDASTVQTRWSTVEIAGHSEALDELLGSVRRYLNANITVSFTEEEYSRVLSYNYSLKDYFGEEQSIVSYSLSSSTPDSVLTQIGTILSISATLDRSYSASEYSKICEYNSTLAQYFSAKASTISYVLASTVKGNETIIQQLEDIIGQVTYATGRLNTRTAYSIYATDMLPGTILQLITKNAGKADTVEEIQIGATGSYRADFTTPVTSIVLPRTIVNDEIYITGLQGSITYSYESSAVNVFDTIRDLEIIDIPDRQWIGLQTKTYYDMDKDDTVTTHDLVKIIEDIKTDLVDIFLMRFEKRELVDIYINQITQVDGTESDGVLLSKLPVGVKLELASSSEGQYALDPDTHYLKYQKPIYGQDPENPSLQTIIGYDECYRTYKTNETIDETNDYVKVYNYYTDRECNQLLELNNLDPYYVYRICNARFDYTYDEVWYEDDYIESNLKDAYYIPVTITEEEFNKGLYTYYTQGEQYSKENRYKYIAADSYSNFKQYYILAHGYYVNKDGEKYPLETGMYLDGLSTQANRLIYTADKYSNKIYINGEEMDLSETGRYSIVNFDETVSSLSFDNGIICDMSYQIRQINYNLESTNDTVASYKATYDSYVSKLEALRNLVSLKEDYELSVSGLDLDSNEYTLLTANYRMESIAYQAILGEDYNEKSFNFAVLQDKYYQNIQSSYSDFIYQLTVALKEYKEANSIV